MNGALPQAHSKPEMISEHPREPDMCGATTETKTALQKFSLKFILDLPDG
jgi:hypothetical protein